MALPIRSATSVKLSMSWLICTRAGALNSPSTCLMGGSMAREDEKAIRSLGLADW